MFDPKNSSSYMIVPCHSKACGMLKHRPCDREDSPCEYSVTYADHSFVQGLLSTETLWLDSPETTSKVPLRGFIIGCTHHTEGQFSSGSVGIIALSEHTLSNFGTAAVVSGPGAISTPFNIINSLYIIYLHHISVVGPMGRTFTINLERTALRDEPMIVDTGTYITYINRDAMKHLSDELVKIITNRRVDVPEHLAKMLNLCFDWKNPMKMPKITFMFHGGAVVHLVDPFMLVKKLKIMCFVIASNDLSNKVSIFGNNAQMDHHIGFNLNKHRITIRPPSN